VKLIHPSEVILIEIGAIPVFVKVSETGGFAAAARQLGLTKSAVSKRISTLEAHLGAQLFHRSTRSISLTEAGEIYLAHAVQALGSAREAEDAVAALQDRPVGQLRICAPVTFGLLHVAPLVTEFLQTHPGITLDLAMDDRVVDLVDAGYDMAIRAGAMPDSALIARRLTTIKSVIVASPKYVTDYGAPMYPEDLIDHNCLHYTYSRDPLEWAFAGPEGETKIKTKGTLGINNSEALCRVLIDGLGVGRLPTFVASSHIRAGRLIRVIPQHILPEQALYAVFPERRHIPAKVRAFTDFLVHRIGGDIAYWDAEAAI
jgi:DNA-binding transcriptional LysR family regulator